MEIIIDACIDSLKALPFLFLAYYVIEYLEHKVELQRIQGWMKHKKAGVCVGALLGAFPQCGFSVTSANLYTSHLISAGTVLAVFISTSDEAIPILLAEPEMLPQIAKILLIKIAAGIVVGLLVDFIWRNQRTVHNLHDVCQECHCEERSILKSALHHTGELFLFLLAVNLILGFVMAGVSEAVLEKLFLNGSIFQPFLTSLIGLIPNCAASVALTELYLAGHIAFGSLIAGLCSGAGLGMVLLFKMNKHMKDNMIILAVLYGTAVITGMLVNIG